jgi:hypothetical protein
MITYLDHLLAGAVAGAMAVGLATNASAQDSTTRKISDYTCKDVMRDNGEGRDIAIAFMHGYLLGKSGGSEFDLEVLTKQSDAFIEYCLDNPTAPAMGAMMKVKG